MRNSSERGERVLSIGTKRCAKCHKVKKLSEYYGDKYRKYQVKAYCISCCKELYQQPKVRKQTNDRCKRYYWKKRADKICTRCRKEKVALNKTICDNCLKLQSIQSRERHSKLKNEVLKHYGNKCVHCGTSDIFVLSIDHINNDGAEHRRKKGKCFGGVHIYNWLKKNNYPEDFQILCRNCNWRKRMGEKPYNYLENQNEKDIDYYVGTDRFAV